MTTNSTPIGARLEILEDAECFRLLERAGVGRVGLSAEALPVILPINFALDGQRAVFATERGTKLTAARQHAVACLEVDGFDALSHGGWSVLATGRLRELTGAEADAAAALPVSPWALDEAPRHYVELGIELVSGRRINRP